MMVFSKFIIDDHKLTMNHVRINQRKKIPDIDHICNKKTANTWKCIKYIEVHKILGNVEDTWKCK